MNVITYSLFPSAFVCVAGPLRNLKRRAVPSGTILLLLIVCALVPSAWAESLFVVNQVLQHCCRDRLLNRPGYHPNPGRRLSGSNLHVTGSTQGLCF